MWNFVDFVGSMVQQCCGGGWWFVVCDLRERERERESNKVINKWIVVVRDIVWVVKLCVKVTFCVFKNVFFYKPGY